MTEYIQVGTTGTPWGEHERRTWVSRQSIKRTYQEEVLNKIDTIKERDSFDIDQYGVLSMDAARYPLFVVKTRNWSADKKVVLVTGGMN